MGNFNERNRYQSLNTQIKFDKIITKLRELGEGYYNRADDQQWKARNNLLGHSWYITKEGTHCFGNHIKGER